jgi:hypothetical protein
MKLRTLLFFIAVVPCLPLLCIIVVLLQQGTPVHQHAIPRDSWDKLALPKQLLEHGREMGEVNSHKCGVVSPDAITKSHVTHAVANTPLKGVDPEVLRLTENPDIVARGMVS